MENYRADLYKRGHTDSTTIQTSLLQNHFGISEGTSNVASVNNGGTNSDPSPLGSGHIMCQSPVGKVEIHHASRKGIWPMRERPYAICRFPSLHLDYLHALLRSSVQIRVRY